jgi:VWFA-related protein
MPVHGRVEVRGDDLRLTKLAAWGLMGGMTMAAAAQGAAAGQSGVGAQSGVGQVSSADGQKGTYALTVKSQMVVLDVVVTNRDGQPVDHLTKDDFTVYEDKVPQRIVSFEAAQDAASAAAKTPVEIHSTAELDRLEPQAPVSLIVLDEVTTRFEDEAFARYSLKQYLKTQGDMLAQPTMLMAVNLDKLQVLQDYTTSKRAILEALDHHFAGYNWRGMSGSWQSEQFSAAFSSLMAVAQATAGHPGHKNMVWVGRGFPSVNWEALPEDEQEQAQALIQKCAELLRSSRVTLYAVDPAGLSVAPPAEDADGFLEDDPFGGQVDFDSMAQETGGQAFHGRNDVDHLIGTSVHDGQTFYTLAYRPAEVTDTSKPFRNITVKLRTPGLKAVTREGYYVQPPAVVPAFDAEGKPSQQMAVDVALASQSLLVYDGIPLTVTRDAARPDLFHLGMKAASVPWTVGAEGPRTTDLILAVESFDRKGKLMVHSVRKLTVTLKPLAEGAPDTAAVALAVTIATAPPAARVRIVVRSDGSGKVGAENVFLIDRKLLSDPTTGVEAEKSSGRRH